MAVEEQEIFSLPPGYHFRPTDYELLIHYLCPKLTGAKTSQNVIPTIDIYKQEPWDLPRLSKLDGEVLYFLCPRESKSTTGSRTNRSTLKGHWKSTGKDRKVCENELKKLNFEAKKKTLVYYLGRAPKGTRTDWVMHEYRLEGKNLKFKNDYVLCRVLNKKIEEDATPNGTEECADTIKDPPSIFPNFHSTFNPTVPNTNSSTPHRLSHLSHSNPQCTPEPNDNLDFEISPYIENADSPNASAGVNVFQRDNPVFPIMDGIFPSSSTNSLCSLSSSVAKGSPHSEINQTPFDATLSKQDGEVENPMDDISNLLNPEIDASQFYQALSETTQTKCDFGEIHIEPPDPCLNWTSGLGEIPLQDSEEFCKFIASLDSSQWQSDNINIEDFMIEDPRALFEDDNGLQCQDPTTSAPWVPSLNGCFMDGGRTSNEGGDASLPRTSPEFQDAAPQNLSTLNGTNRVVSVDALLQDLPQFRNHESSSRGQMGHDRYQEALPSMSAGYFTSVNAARDKCLKEDSQTKVKEDFVNMVKKKMENRNGNGSCKAGVDEVHSVSSTKIKIRASLNANRCESQYLCASRTRMVLPKAMTTDAGKAACNSLNQSESGVEDEILTDEETGSSCARTRLFPRKPWNQFSTKAENKGSSKSAENDALHDLDLSSINNHASVPSAPRHRGTPEWVPSASVNKAPPSEKLSTERIKPKSYLNFDSFFSSDSFMRSLLYIPSSPAHAETLKLDRENERQNDQATPNVTKRIVYNDSDSGSDQVRESTSESVDSSQTGSNRDDGLTSTGLLEVQSSFPSGIKRTAHRRGNPFTRFLDQVLLVFIFLCLIAAALPILVVRFIEAVTKHPVFRKTFYLGAFVTLAYFLFHYS